jgi:hypothetical protein
MAMRGMEMRSLTLMLSIVAAASACAIPEEERNSLEGESTGMDGQPLSKDDFEEVPFEELPDHVSLAATSVAVLNTDGTRAATAWFNSGPDKNYWDIKDEKCDGKSPNLNYNIGGIWRAVQLNTGCGTERRFFLTQGSAGQSVGYYLTLTTSFARSSTVNDVKG